ncbi:MAG: hypothetical protein HWN65_19585 [Candidatus Helarchaeota archaeon]|nr:hypothetical protein [Candidatus Helarchaeota archaeon]
MADSSQKIVFVYNADGDFFSLVKDFFHKTFKPSTYPCNLCGITYSIKNFGKKKEWKHFINRLNIPAVFLHRDEFQERYTLPDAKFPSAYIETGSNLELFISQEEMNGFNNLEDLKSFMLEKGKGFGVSLNQE